MKAMNQNLLDKKAARYCHKSLGQSSVYKSSCE
jgi:hypothetical protein